MDSNRSRAAVGVVLVAGAVVLFLVLRDDDGNGSSSQGTTTERQVPVPTIELKGGEPVGGVQDLTVTSGDRVRFRVTSDIEGEVHVHGYEIAKPVRAGGNVGFDFPADLEGSFEVELHHGGGENQIADLQVQPG